MSDELHTLITAEIIHPDLKQMANDPAAYLEHLGIDGIARAHLAMQIEDAFSVHLLDNVVQGWNTVSDVEQSLRRAKAMGDLIASGD